MKVQCGIGRKSTGGDSSSGTGRSGGACRCNVVPLLFVVAVAAAAGIAGPLDAQTAPAGSAGTTSSRAAEPPSSLPDTAQTPAGAIAAMKKDLLRLVSANEVYFAKNQWYSEDLHALQGYHPSPGVSVTILTADADAWAAQATSTLLPGKSCVVYVGPLKNLPKTRADGRTGSEAVAVCDRP